MLLKLGQCEALEQTGEQEEGATGVFSLSPCLGVRHWLCLLCGSSSYWWPLPWAPVTPSVMVKFMSTCLGCGAKHQMLLWRFFWMWLIFTISWLSKADYPPKCRWASSSPWEQKPKFPKEAILPQGCSISYLNFQLPASPSDFLLASPYNRISPFLKSVSLSLLPLPTHLLLVLFLWKPLTNTPLLPIAF